MYFHHCFDGFSPTGIVKLLGSAYEDWSLQTLRGATEANFHGYTKDSNAIVQLLNIMSTFSSEERRAFSYNSSLALRFAYPVFKH